MNELEAREVVAIMRRKWAGWEPTDAEVDDNWLPLLQKFSKGTAVAGLQDAWENSAYRQPVPKALLAAIRSKTTTYVAGNADRGQDGAGGYAGAYIECTEAPTEKPQYLGWRLGLYYGVSSRVPPPAQVKAAAEQMRTQHQALYGGRWTAFCDNEAAAVVAPSAEPTDDFPF